VRREKQVRGCYQHPEQLRQFLYTMLASISRDSLRRDSLPVCLGSENPNRLVSLWDMLLKFHAHILVERLALLGMIQLLDFNRPLKDKRKLSAICKE
jgi:hypothetical protein